MAKSIRILFLLAVVVATLWSPAVSGVQATPSSGLQFTGSQDSGIYTTTPDSQISYTFEELGFQTAAFNDGDTATITFDTPYQQPSAVLNLNLTAAPVPAAGSHTLDLQVSDPADDCYTSKTWEVLCKNERILRLGNHSICGQCSVFARFTGLSGLQGATITNAYLEVYNHASQGAASVTIAAEDAQDPAQILYARQHRRATRTTSSVNWSGTLPTGWNQSPPITPVIQELVDKYDPSAIQILIDFDSLTPPGNSWELLSWEYIGHDRAIKLHIDYQFDGNQPDPGTSTEDSVDVFINDTFLSTVSFNSPAANPIINVPAGILSQGTNTLRLEFSGPSSKTLVNDSSINITDTSS